MALILRFFRLIYIGFYWIINVHKTLGVRMIDMRCKVLIRASNILDAEGRGYVHYQSWLETYTGIFPDEVMNSLSVEKSIQMARNHPENTQVALVNNKIVGFVTYTGSRDEDLKYAGEIMAIYVLKAYQNQGIGKQLMRVAYQALSDYKTVFLWVLSANKKTVTFYETEGFRFDGHVKKLHNHDIIRMVKKKNQTLID